MWLFDWVKRSKKEALEVTEECGTQHRFEFINGAPLNDSNSDLKVNFLEHWETRSYGQIWCMTEIPRQRPRQFFRPLLHHL
jgi:hypothetical protein